MVSSRPEIWVGDLVRAINALEISDWAQVSAISKVLGIQETNYPVTEIQMVKMLLSGRQDRVPPVTGPGPSRRPTLEIHPPDRRFNNLVTNGRKLSTNVLSLDVVSV